ncbi:unnamed protein product [Gordionus sp. m RMFG-2023]
MSLVFIGCLTVATITFIGWYKSCSRQKELIRKMEECKKRLNAKKENSEAAHNVDLLLHNKLKENIDFVKKEIDIEKYLLNELKFDKVILLEDNDEYNKRVKLIEWHQGFSKN